VSQIEWYRSLGVTAVGDADGGVVDGVDDEVVEGFGVGDTANGAKGLVLLAGGDVAAGDVGGLADEGFGDAGDGDFVGIEAVAIDPDVDGTFEAADDQDFAHAVGTLDLGLDDFVGELGEFADGTVAGEGEGDGEDDGAFVIELGDDGRVYAGGQLAEDGGDAVARVLGGGVDVAVEVEGGDEPGPGSAWRQRRFANHERVEK